MKRIFLGLIASVTLAFALGAARADDAPAPGTPPGALRVYFIGNSVTDNINYEGLAALAKSRGIEQVWGRHMIPGAPLRFIWNNPDGGFRRSPYGSAREALAKHAWDVVTLQPFDRKLDQPADQADLPVLREIIDTALTPNPKTRFLIYSRWPRMRQGGKSMKYDAGAFDPNKPGGPIDLSTIDPYAEHWLKKYTGGWDGTIETRDYFERVVAALREAYPQIRDQIELVPVGDTLLALDTMMRAGSVPGYTNVFQFYKDTIHMNPLGSYTTGCVFFAQIYRQSPLGLPTEPYGDFPPEITLRIQEAAAASVRHQHP
jgi:hypothetical protein